MLHTEKADLRREMRLCLKKAANSIAAKSPLILARLMTMDEVQHAWHSERLMSFVSMPLEVDTRPLFAEKSMIVPYCESGDIKPFRIQSLNELEPSGNLQILEPTLSVRQNVSRHVSLEQIAVVLVPGLAFDGASNRLGRGKGYYDRFLRSLPSGVLTIGLAVEEMMRDRIPHGENDCPVKVVLTEYRMIKGK